MNKRVINPTKCLDYCAPAIDTFEAVTERGFSLSIPIEDVGKDEETEF